MRRMRDLPWQGKRVEIHLQARRFRCRNNACDRKIFAETMPDLAGPKARETTRLCEIVGVALHYKLKSLVACFQHFITF
jgi:hypothetical protein